MVAPVLKYLIFQVSNWDTNSGEYMCNSESNQADCLRFDFSRIQKKVIITLSRYAEQGVREPSHINLKGNEVLVSLLPLKR